MEITRRWYREYEEHKILDVSNQLALPRYRRAKEVSIKNIYWSNMIIKYRLRLTIYRLGSFASWRDR
jgi:hypothetical protein